MEKKTKLTISGTAKKSFKNIELAKTQGKNSVVIEKQPSKFPSSCLLYTSPSPRDQRGSRMPSSA